MENKININIKQMLTLLTAWSESYIQKQNETILFSLSPSMKIGSGSFERFIDKPYEIEVGISPYSKSFMKRYIPVRDLDFSRACVTIYHEFAHYEQYKAQSDTEILASDLSKHGNTEYYKYNWNIMPHEIDAEYSGVISAQKHLRDTFSNNADELIEQYLRYRAENMKYMIKVPDGSISEKGIEELFEKAYDRSMTNKRIIPSNFLRSGDEAAQMFTFEDGTLRREYELFYRQLQTAGTGQEMDMKMASLVSYLHPDLQGLYPGLNFTVLKPESVFGIPMPESRDEIMARIDSSLTGSISFDSISDDEFTQAVDSISEDAVVQAL